MWQPRCGDCRTKGQNQSPWGLHPWDTYPVRRTDGFAGRCSVSLLHDSALRLLSERSTLLHFLNSHSPSSLLSSSFCSTPSTGGCLGRECQCPLGLQTPRAPLTFHLAWPLSALGTPSRSSFPVVWHGFLLASAPLPLYFPSAQLWNNSCWGFSFRSWVRTFISKSWRFSSEL